MHCEFHTSRFLCREKWSFWQFKGTIIWKYRGRILFSMKDCPNQKKQESWRTGLRTKSAAWLQMQTRILVLGYRETRWKPETISRISEISWAFVSWFDLIFTLTAVTTVALHGVSISQILNLKSVHAVAENHNFKILLQL